MFLLSLYGKCNGLHSGFFHIYSFFMAKVLFCVTLSNIAAIISKHFYLIIIRKMTAMQQLLPTTLIPSGHRLTDEAVQTIAEWLTKNNNDRNT